MKHTKQDRAWELLDAIGEADEGFLADANEKQQKRRGRQRLRKYGSIAACLALALLLPVLALLPQGRNGTVPAGSEGSQAPEGSNNASSAGADSSYGEGTSDPDDIPTAVVLASGPDLMEGIRPTAVAGQEADDAFLQAQMRFSLGLLQQLAKGEREAGNSLLISPLSAQFTLSMAANGAGGETRAEMLSLLAGDLSMGQLNSYLHTLRERLTEETEGCKVNIASAIWYNEWVEVYLDFLQTNGDHYGAGAYRMPFDEETLGSINRWVSDQTEGMIPRVLDEIDPEAAMYLLGTVLFDGEWNSIYLGQVVGKGVFTAYDGKPNQVTFMHSEEGVYYEDGLATGFAKNYKGGKYAFVALLPNEGVDVYDYVAGLTAEGLLHTLQNGKQTSVSASLPKFSFAYETKLAEPLSDLGMKSAFSPGAADFSRMMTCEGYLKSVNQKTVISVGELGTKAAAVTVAVSSPTNEPTYAVHLNRPFVYLIVDRATNLPLFMGVQTEIDDSGVPEGEAPALDVDDDGSYAEPEPPSYDGKDFTGLTVRLKDDYVWENTDLLVFRLENDSETEYAYQFAAILLQKKTADGWETLPRLSATDYQAKVEAGKTGDADILLQRIYGIRPAAGETYRAVFPGVEGLACEFTVIGRENGTPDASELRITPEDGIYAGMTSPIYTLANNSRVPFVYSFTDILLEHKTSTGWETFTLLAPDDRESVLDPGEQRTTAILPAEYGVELEAGETYRIAFRNVPGLYGEFVVQ